MKNRLQDISTPELVPQTTTAGNNVRASWNFSADALAANTAHYNAEARELLRWCFSFCIDPRHSMRREEFAKRVGYSDNVIWKIYTGSYKHPQSGELLDVPAKLVNAMRQFRKVERERAELGAKGFVRTPSVLAMWDHCDLAREMQMPLMIVGGSQIGKTVALVQYALRNNHGSTPYVRLAASSGMHGMIRAIAEAVGVSPKSEAKRLVQRIINAISPNTLLILDEVHLLAYTYRKESFFACLEVIREIYDATQCGMILCMTNIGYGKIEAERKNALEQLCKRGPVPLKLGQAPTVDDVRAIVCDWRLEWPGPRTVVEAAGVKEHPLALLRQLAREEGLTAIMARLYWARKLATRASEDLTWEHVIEAHYTIIARNTPPQPW